MIWRYLRLFSWQVILIVLLAVALTDTVWPFIRGFFGGMFVTLMPHLVNAHNTVHNTQGNES